jgi:hypothetical protein
MARIRKSPHDRLVLRKVRPYLTAGVAGLALIALVWTLTTRPERDAGRPEVELVGLPAQVVGDEALLGWAETVIAGRCMVAQGFPFAVAAPTSAGTSSEERLAELYGITDVALAEKRGYGITPRFRRPSAAAEDANRQYVSAMDAGGQRAYTTAYFGDDDHRVEVKENGVVVAEYGSAGCLAKARTHLYGSLQDWADLDTWAMSLDRHRLGRLQETPRGLADLHEETRRAGGQSCGQPGSDQ